MIKKNQTIKDVTFASLSYGSEEHVQLGNIKLTLPQSEIYLHANNYKSVVFIGGRGAGKSFLGKLFIEDYASCNELITVSPFPPNNDSRLFLNKFRKYRYINWYRLGLSGFNTDTVLHLEEPFAQPVRFDDKLLLFRRFFVETTVPDLDLNNDLHRWFIDLVGLDSTLTVIGNTVTNYTLQPAWYASRINNVGTFDQENFLKGI